MQGKNLLRRRFEFDIWRKKEWNGELDWYSKKRGFYRLTVRFRECSAHLPRGIFSFDATILVPDADGSEEIGYGEVSFSAEW